MQEAQADTTSTPGLGRLPGGSHCNPLQYSCLENPMDRGAWRAIVYRVAESDTTEAVDRACPHTILSFCCYVFRQGSHTFKLWQSKIHFSGFHGQYWKLTLRNQAKTHETFKLFCCNENLIDYSQQQNPDSQGQQQDICPCNTNSLSNQEVPDTRLSSEMKTELLSSEYINV